MPYATVDDMVTRFGAAEMIRLSTPQDQPMDVVNDGPILLALGDASDLIDTYCAKRYATPIDGAPSSISRAACILARYDLCAGDGREASESVRLARRETITWLENIAAGKANLPLDEVQDGDQSNAQMADRNAVYGPGINGNVVSGNLPYPNSSTGSFGSGGLSPPLWDQGLPGYSDGSP